MFKRNKSKLTPPAPPSLEEILEDLQIFRIERPPTTVQPVRSLSTDSLSYTNTSLDVAEWWKLFQTFQSDVASLEILQKKLMIVKNVLDTENHELREKIDLILTEIDEALDKVSKGIPNDD